MRIFLSQTIDKQNIINLSPELVHRLYNVLRLQVEDVITVFNSNFQGIEFLAKIHTINKKNCVLEILEQTKGISESLIKIELVQSIARGEKMDYIIQKAIELGVNKITPIFTEFCNVKLTGERLNQRLEHWQKIVVHACEQSGRCFVPQVNNSLKFQDYLQIQSNNENCCANTIMLSPRAEISLREFLASYVDFNIQACKLSHLSIVIGSEGGISMDEELQAQKNNVIACSLGKRILRTETASIVALSLIQGLCGDLC